MAHKLSENCPVTGSSLRSLNSDKGFTLVEMLVAITILSVGLLAIAQLLLSSMRNNVYGNSRTVTAGLAQEVVEKIAGMDGSDPFFKTELLGSPSNPWPGVWASNVSLAGGGNYNIYYRTDVDVDGVSNLTRIDVRVEGTGTASATMGSVPRATTLNLLKRYF